MSLVGPRPERPQYAELFVREHAGYERRQEVRPGLTGWAQVHGLRGQSSLADRLRWDNDYVQRWSLWLDLKILLLTMTAVVSDRGEARGSRAEAVRSGDAPGSPRVRLTMRRDLHLGAADAPRDHGLRPVPSAPQAHHLSLLTIAKDRSRSSVARDSAQMNVANDRRK
jgi:hypothetical protein